MLWKLQCNCVKRFEKIRQVWEGHAQSQTVFHPKHLTVWWWKTELEKSISATGMDRLRKWHSCQESLFNLLSELCQPHTQTHTISLFASGVLVTCHTAVTAVSHNLTHFSNGAFQFGLLWYEMCTWTYQIRVGSWLSGFLYENRAK